MLDSRLRGREFEHHRRHCVVSLSKNINPTLVLVQPRKTLPFITERLLMGRKESNQTISGVATVTGWANEKDFEFLLLFIMYFRQHEENYTMSEKEILQDIVAYCPAVAGVTGAMPAKDVQRLIGKTRNLGHRVA